MKIMLKTQASILTAYAVLYWFHCFFFVGYTKITSLPNAFTLQTNGRVIWQHTKWTSITVNISLNYQSGAAPTYY